MASDGEDKPVETKVEDTKAEDHVEAKAEEESKDEDAPKVEEKKDDERKEDGAKPGEEAGGRRRKRKSLWDTDAPDAKTATSPALAPLAAVAAIPGITDAAQLQLLQQQQLLQMRALAQAKLSQAAAISTQVAAATSGTSANRIYVGSIYYELTESDMLLTFSPFGPITKIDMPKDSTTGKHKGFCFLEFSTADAAQAAVAIMNDFTLAGRKLKVNWPNNVGSGVPITAGNPLAGSQINTAQYANAKLQAQAICSSIDQRVVPGYAGMAATMATPTATAVPQSTVNTRIYIGSIVYDLKEADVSAIFQAFGPIRSCQLIPNPETGKHKGYGFIEFETEEAAKGAIQCMNGFTLGGRQLKVGWASSTSAPSASVTSPMTSASAFTSPTLAGMPFAGIPGMFPGMTAAQPAAAAAYPGFAAAAGLGSMIPGMGGLGGMGGIGAMGAGAPAAAAAQLAQEFVQEQRVSIDKEENMHIGRDQRQAMMQKLAARDGPVAQGPCRCIILRNMVSPEEVDDDLQSEVTEECGKYGKVERVVIYQEQQSSRPGDAVVKIFVLFSAISEAQAALSALHNRWFGGRQVKAAFYNEALFAADNFAQ